MASGKIMVGPADHKGKKIPLDISILTTLISKAALMLSNVLAVIACCFQSFGYLLSMSLLDVLWKLAVSACLVYLGTFHCLDKQH
jgi:hypothetical protein